MELKRDNTPLNALDATQVFACWLFSVCVHDCMGSVLICCMFLELLLKMLRS